MTSVIKKWKLHRIGFACLLLTGLVLVLFLLSSRDNQVERSDNDANESDLISLNYWQFAKADRNIENPSSLEVQAPQWLSLDMLHTEPSQGGEGPGARWYKYRFSEHELALSSEPHLFLFTARYKVSAYVDDRLIYQFGPMNSSVGPSYIGEPHHSIQLPKDMVGKFVYVRVESDLPKIGVVGPVFIGSQKSIVAYMMKTEMLGLMVGSVSFLVGLATLLVASIAMRRRGILAFGGFCACIGLYSISSAKIIYLLSPYPLAWDHIQCAATYLAPALFIEFVSQITGKFKWSWIKHVRWLFVGLSVIATFGSLVGYIEMPNTLTFFQMSVLAIGILLSIEITRKVVSGNLPAKLIGAGVLLQFVSAFYDVLVQRQILSPSVNLSGLSTLGFITLLLLAFAMRLKEELVQRAHIRSELEAARVLQDQFMPPHYSHYLQCDIDAFNAAAASISGDWYSYRLIEERYLHVHVGDVTGHGANAALLAAFAKGATDIIYEDCRDQGTFNPDLGRIHMLLNRTLCDIGSGRATMTLASIAIDLQTGDSFYVNSGHPPPIVHSHSNNKTIKLHSSNAMMLGIGIDFVANPSKAFRVVGDEAVFLYSDGASDLAKSNGVMKFHEVANAFFDRYLPSIVKNEAWKKYEKVFSLLTGAPEFLRDDVTILRVKLHIPQTPSLGTEAQILGALPAST